MGKYDNLIEAELERAFNNADGSEVAVWTLPNDAKPFDENDFSGRFDRENDAWAAVFTAAVEGLSRPKK